LLPFQLFNFHSQLLLYSHRLLPGAPKLLKQIKTAKNTSSPSQLSKNQRKNQNHNAAPITIGQNNFLQLPLDSPGCSTKVYF